MKNLDDNDFYDAWSGWCCCHEVYVRVAAPRLTVRTTDTFALKLPRVVVTATHNTYSFL